MQDMKIEYRDGKLVEPNIDGICFRSVTTINLQHEVGKTLPTVTLTMPLCIGGRLVQRSQTREKLRIIEK